jgi:hypothetical protein
METDMKALAIASNHKGTKFALVKGQTAKANSDKTISYAPSFGVFKLCENYDGKVRGGARQTWRYVEKDLTIDAARSLFFLKTGTAPVTAN